MQWHQDKVHNPDINAELVKSAHRATTDNATAAHVPAWANGDTLPAGLQAKLTINQPGDIYEQEADRVAEQVMRMPVPQIQRQKKVISQIKSPSSQINPLLQKRADEKEVQEEEDLSVDEEDRTLQRRSASSSSESTAPPIVSQALSSGNGQPLDTATRAFMEPRFGADFSQVRVHTDVQAAESAQSVSALAYTVGSDVVFGKGQYQPQTSEGQRLLAHELTHVVQQTTLSSLSGAQIQRQSPASKQTDRIQEEVENASRRFPNLARPLSEATLRAVVSSDRTLVDVMGVGKFTYPSQIMRAQQGFYAYRWDAKGDPVGLVNLATGSTPSQTDRPLIHQLAGMQELQELRANRIGIIWVTQTVTSPPPPHAPTPDELELPLPPRYEIDAGTFRRMQESLGPRPLTILGLTGGVFNPKQAYERPLNFTYYTQDGVVAVVGRRLADREFYYQVPISDIQNYLRTYPVVYAGVAASGWIPITRLLFDVGIGFIPIIGPLYGLAMAALAVRDAYKNWDHMSGWEKGLVGVTVLLSVVPAIRSARNIVRGAAAYRSGVRSLVSAGLTRGDARRLMLAAGVFQSERATLRVVDTLGDALRRGERLTATELQQVQRVFQLMLQRLPAAERTVIAASFATQNLSKAREFFGGIELTETHLAGLRKLAPEVLADLQRVGRSEPILVQRVASWAARTETVASGINKLQGVVKGTHLTYVLTEAGEDVLAQLGREGAEISPELARFVKAARTSREAYRRLMQGTAQGGRDIPGLVQLLSAMHPEGLAPALITIRDEFRNIFLTVDQLGGLARLNASARTALQHATDSELRLIASAAAESSDAALAINQLTSQLAPVLTRNHLPYILNRISGGLLRTVGSTGATLSAELVARIARQTSALKAADVLLKGFNEGATHISGLLDIVAGRLTSVTSAENALRLIQFPSLQGELFARWALANPNLLRTVSSDLAEGVSLISRLHGDNALQKISGIYRAFSSSHEAALAVFQSLGRAERMYGTNMNIQRLVSDLAAGAEKSMGASLVLNYITLRNLKTITALEYSVTVAGRNRVYDLFADGIYYEFKYWLGFGGRPAADAADEFARDVVFHASTNFSQLRWVISKDAVGQLPAIESMMRGVLARPWVQRALRHQGLSIEQVRASLDDALRGDGLLTFF